MTGRMHLTNGLRTPFYARNNREDMAMYLEMMENQREYEHVKEVPPLDIILYRDLMEITWSWDRLLPWKYDYVHIENYMDYVNGFFYRNAPFVLMSLHDAASRCLEMEEKLSGCAQGFTPDDVRLSDEIKEYARFILGLDLESPAAAACFMCIAEEADFMAELLACKTKNDVDEDVFITEVLDDDSLNFSKKIRRVAFDILTTYKGPFSSQCIAATMLGMRKEANLLHELLLLNPNHNDRFARLNVCEALQLRLLNYFICIRDRLAPNATSSFNPITKGFPQLFTSEPCKESGNTDETGFHITDNWVAVPSSTPITATTATPAAPISRVAIVAESDQENKNNKSKSMGETQGSEVPISQASENADEKRDGCRSSKRDEDPMECPVFPPDEQEEAVRPDGLNADGEEKQMLEEATVIEGGSMKALVGLGKEIVALLKALLVVAVAVLCALCIDVYVHCNR